MRPSTWARSRRLRSNRHPPSPWHMRKRPAHTGDTQANWRTEKDAPRGPMTAGRSARDPEQTNISFRPETIGKHLNEIQCPPLPRRLPNLHEPVVTHKNQTRAPRSPDQIQKTETLPEPITQHPVINRYAGGTPRTGGGEVAQEGYQRPHTSYYPWGRF